MKILAINAGSSSLKFRLADTGGDPLAEGDIRSIGTAARGRLLVRGTMAFEGAVEAADHGEAAGRVLAWLAERALPAEAAGHRVVHGGTRFTRTTRIDPAVLEAIEALGELAPLHNPPAHRAIVTSREALGSSVPMAAVFDTAFHRRMPEHAAIYGIPADLAERHGIVRFGFHGIAHQYMTTRYARITGRPPGAGRLITLQLGHGSSAAAVRDGHSVDTSMGFTPLEGLMMPTRSGDVDPAIVAFLAEKERVDTATVIDWLNRRSGLLGISGRTADMRELLMTEDRDPRARLAIDAYCYRIRKYIGAYMAALDGAEAVIFSGGIGENAPAVRARILEGMDWCGLAVDPDANRRAVATEARISPEGAAREIHVIPMDEERIIVEETARCLEA